MAARANRSLPGRWSAVLLCCVLSVTAPRDLTALGQWLDGSLYLPSAAPILVEQDEPIDEEDSLLRSASPGDSLRLYRKHAQEQPLLVRPPFETPHGVEPTHHADPFHPCRPGCEHAFRNGCGSVLLC